MILSFFAQATPGASPTPAGSPGLLDGIIDEKSLWQGIATTNLTLMYFGLVAILYIGMVVIGRILKRRFKASLGWSYQMLAIALALALPAMLPQIELPFGGERELNAFLTLAFAFAFIGFLRHTVFRVFFQQKRNTTVPKFLSEPPSLAAVLLALRNISQAVHAVAVPVALAGAGIAGIVLGLALQDTLGNVFSGFAIYFGGQFKSGDWLLIGGQHAEIMEVNWRSTRLRTNDNVFLDIPNNAITKDTVVNYSHPSPLHAMRLQVGLDYDAPPSKVRQVLIEATQAASGVLADPGSSVCLAEFASSSVNYEIKYWIDDHSRFDEIASTIRTNLWYALRRNNITIPYPIQVEMFHEAPKNQPDKRSLVRDALARVFFFECLDETQRSRLIDNARLVRFGANEQMMRQGQEGKSMYVITEGGAEVFVHVGGTQRSVARIGAGDCIGEMSLLTGERRSATIMALTDVMAVEIEKGILTPVISSSPELLERLSDLLAKRRLQNEGLTSETTGPSSSKHDDYKFGFLTKLKSFFEL